ncbi:SDR family NAD(P)-dependent oxidoreductase [Sneathiella limimaris]|uniref:SDR family NAD(P)-dependent oxidoreductase n=1 Tax=Sneathiella limimaris TaxID=1964213 RepID=UPI00146F73AA|nr:SDR family NAD(P)-dependent oxidoreductase [Sneathiella limimaris]
MKPTKTVAITGGGEGIGAALTKLYASQGYHVAIAGRNVDKLKIVQSACTKLGGLVSYTDLDVQDAKRVSEWLHGLDNDSDLQIVIANAGITGGIKPEDQLEAIENTQSILCINLLGSINTLQPAAEIFLKKGTGKIAAISSLASYVGFSGSPGYCSSKAGLRIYCESLSRLLQNSEISVTTIFPGYVKTSMADRVNASKPLQISATEAAQKIAKAIEKGKPEFGFPCSLWVGVRFLSILPAFLKHKLANFFDYSVNSQ